MALTLHMHRLGFHGDQILTEHTLTCTCRYNFIASIKYVNSDTIESGFAVRTRVLAMSSGITYEVINSIIIQSTSVIYAE